MKKLLIIIVIVSALSACTENIRTRNFGGTSKIYLPKGEKLINVTWKDADLWYITEKMPDNYIPKFYTFQEKSSFGVWEGTYILIEVK